jgi:hypothetical protein
LGQLGEAIARRAGLPGRATLFEPGAAVPVTAQYRRLKDTYEWQLKETLPALESRLGALVYDTWQLEWPWLVYELREHYVRLLNRPPGRSSRLQRSTGCTIGTTARPHSFRLTVLVPLTAPLQQRHDDLARLWFCRHSRRPATRVALAQLRQWRGPPPDRILVVHDVASSYR